MSIEIGLFYGSSTCYTEMAAEKIRDSINRLSGRELVVLHNIASDPSSPDGRLSIFDPRHPDLGLWRTTGRLGIPLGCHR